MFSKAPVRRFNDSKDTNPPPGAYDPKFLTDMSVSATSKGPTFLPLKGNHSRENSKTRSRPSSPSPASSFIRIRSSSFQRPSTTTTSNDEGSHEGSRRNLSQPPLNRTWASLAFPVSASPEIACDEIKNHPTLELEATEQVSTLQVRNSSKKDMIIENEELNQKIDQLEQRLANVHDKTQIHEKENKTYENMISLLQSQVDKYETDKSDWENTEKALTNSIKILQSSEEELQNLLVGFQTKYMPLLEEKEGLQKQINILEKENSQLAATDIQLQNTISELQKLVEDQQTQINDTEEKCRIMVENVTECYRISQERVMVAESEKETFLGEKKEWVKKETEYLETIKSFQGQMKESILLDMISLDAETSFQQVMEKELNEYRKSETSRRVTDDNTQALKRQWADKESSYLNAIDELKKKIKFLENNSEEFAKHASGIIEDIAGTKKYNETLKNKINLLNAERQDQNLFLIEPYAIVDMDIDERGLDAVTPPEEVTSLSDDDSAHYVVGPCVDSSSLDEETDTEPSMKEKIQRLKNCEKEIAKSCEKDLKKREKTMSLISSLENENKKTRDFISYYTSVLGSDSDVLSSNPLMDINNNTTKSYLRETDYKERKVSSSSQVQSFSPGESETDGKVKMSKIAIPEKELNLESSETNFLYNVKPKKTSSLNRGTGRDRDSTTCHATTSEPMANDIAKSSNRNLPVVDGVRSLRGNRPSKTSSISKNFRKNDSKFGNTCANLCSFLDDVPEEDISS